jgi:hypothetical protein
MAVETFHYDNQTTKWFALATIIWGVVGFLVGVYVAFHLFLPELAGGLSYITFGRMRPLHTNAAIFAFVGNGIFMGVYYSLQRLLKTRMYSDLLSKIPLLGLAADYRSRGSQLRFWDYHKQGIRRAGMAHRYPHRSNLGDLRHQYVYDHHQPTRAANVCRYLVLYFYLYHGSRLAHF